MRLITWEKVCEGMMLPEAWLTIVKWKSKSRFLPKPKSIGFAFYLPWIFNGSWYDPMNRMKRFCWRIPRVLFEIRYIGKFRVRRLYRGGGLFWDFPKLSLYRFFWCEELGEKIRRITND